MAKRDIDLVTEQNRLIVQERLARLERVEPRYRTKAEHDEMAQCRQWMRRNPL